MKNSALIILFFCWAAATFAQNSDCNTAISVCAAAYTETNSPLGTGNVFEMAPGTCQTTGESNSAWYVFTVQQTGVLNFSLNPGNTSDDYDWSVFDISTNGCAGINSGLSPEVSCNSYGEISGTQGSTGISSALGGAGTSNGPGNAFGPPFNQDLQVTQGEVLALVVMNFSGSPSGYSLDFGASTASIFDNQPPSITAHVVNCAQTQITFDISEPLLLDQFNTGNIVLNANGTEYPINNLILSGEQFVSQFGIEAADLPTITGDVTLSFNTPMSDLCGNPLPLTYTFPLYGAFTGTSSTTQSCQGLNGGLVVTATGAAAGCPTFTMNGPPISANCETLTQTTLVPGAYTVIATSSDGACSQTFNLTITDIPVSIEVGADVSLCDLDTTLFATFTGDQFTWSPVAGLTFSDVHDPHSTVSATTGGSYTLNATANTGACQATDLLTIQFTSLPDVLMDLTPEICFNACNGKIVLTDGQNPTLTAIWQNSTLIGNPITIDQLCSGTYDVRVGASAQCTVQRTFTLDPPQHVEAKFEASPWIATIESPTITFTNESTHWDSLHWQVIGVDAMYSGDSIWTAVFPNEIATYGISLTAIDSAGCTSVYTASVIIQDIFKVYVPNSFSPNGDDLNEYFAPVFSYPPLSYSLTIVDRWGQPVFESTDYTKVWSGNSMDGSYFVSDGVYEWLLKVRGEEIDTQIFKGTVTVIR